MYLLVYLTWRGRGVMSWWSKQVFTSISYLERGVMSWWSKQVFTSISYLERGGGDELEG